MNKFYNNELFRRENRIENYIFITVIITLLGLVPDAYLEMYPAMICIAIVSPILIAAYYFNRKQTDIAGTLLLLFITEAIFVSNLYYGARSNNSYFYIAEYITMLLVIDTRNKFYLILNHLHIGVSILTTQLLFFYNFKITPVEANSYIIMGNVNILLSILASLYLFYTFVQESTEKENYLISIHKRINIKNRIIENAQTNLETFIYRASHNLQGPIRSIMGLYHLSVIEDNPEKLKELIELVNNSAKQLDKELSITSQIFKINQHVTTLEIVDLLEFTKQYYKTDSIDTSKSDSQDFKTHADVTMLTEGMNNLYSIYEKLRLTPNSTRTLTLSRTGSIFSFSFTFESINLDDKYLNIFFAPYQKDLAYLYDLTSEPYICRRIMDKLHGDVSIQKIDNHTLCFRVASVLI
jgi:hypothetical protein